MYVEGYVLEGAWRARDTFVSILSNFRGDGYSGDVESYVCRLDTNLMLVDGAPIEDGKFLVVVPVGGPVGSYSYPECGSEGEGSHVVGEVSLLVARWM